MYLTVEIWFINKYFSPGFQIIFSWILKITKITHKYCSKVSREKFSVIPRINFVFNSNNFLYTRFCFKKIKIKCLYKQKIFWFLILLISDFISTYKLYASNDLLLLSLQFNTKQPPWVVKCRRVYNIVPCDIQM